MYYGRCGNVPVVLDSRHAHLGQERMHKEYLITCIMIISNKKRINKDKRQEKGTSIAHIYTVFAYAAFCHDLDKG